MNKKVLLVAGGGTLGTYTAAELLHMGVQVDVLAAAAEPIRDSGYTFFRGNADIPTLTRLMAENRYDAVVNFMHYPNPEEYRTVHRLLIENTGHLVFLSSYRVYADLEHPIRECSPRLIDAYSDPQLLAGDDYGVSKARCEDFLKNECSNDAYTIARPVISFSHRRFDLYTYSGQDLFDYANKGRRLILPHQARDLCAALDWAGNTGKLIAHLLFKPETFGQAYTVSSGQRITWGDAAEYYRELCGLKVEWADEESFINAYPCVTDTKKWLYLYDRKFSRDIDASKILAATGLSRNSFVPLRKALEAELKKAGYIL